MADKDDELMEQQFVDHIVKGGRAIPGQSLTNDPKNPLPFEKAPEFINSRDAIEYIFASLIEEDVYMPLMEQIDAGLPVMEFVQVFLFEGFNTGKWNPDLMLLLAEPMTYMIMALAERIDVDYVVYQGEDEDMADEDEALGTGGAEKIIEKIKAAKDSSTIPAGVLPAEMIKQIEALPVDSLMAAPAQEEQPKPVTDSLMSAPVQEEEEEL